MGVAPGQRYNVYYLMTKDAERACWAFGQALEAVARTIGAVKSMLQLPEAAEVTMQEVPELGIGRIVPTMRGPEPEEDVACAAAAPAPHQPVAPRAAPHVPQSEILGLMPPDGTWILPNMAPPPRPLRPRPVIGEAIRVTPPVPARSGVDLGVLLMWVRYHYVQRQVGRPVS
jgi:hypothetical protein